MTGLINTIRQAVGVSPDRSAIPIVTDWDQPFIHPKDLPGIIHSAVPELAKYSQIVDALVGASYQSQSKFLVVLTDIDGTFVPGAGSSLQQRTAGSLIAHELADLVTAQCGVIIPVTGSSFHIDSATTPSIQERVRRGVLPSKLQALVTDGGARALVVGGPAESLEFAEDAAYQARVTQLKALFNTAEVVRQAGPLVDGLNNGSIPASPVDLERVSEVAGQRETQRMYLQPHLMDSEGAVIGHSVSYYFYANSLEERDAVEQLFRDSFNSDVCIVCCEEIDFNKHRDARHGRDFCASKYCLDITPVDKSTPVSYFTDLIDRAIEAINRSKKSGDPMEAAVWYCCDGGNDIVAARHKNVDHVCMVGGASSELVRHADSLRQAGKDVYVESDPTVYSAASIIKSLQNSKMI